MSRSGGRPSPRREAGITDGSVDDSGSMLIEEGGERIKDLMLILGRVAYAASLFDRDGIQVRFMNSSVQGNSIRTESEAESLVRNVSFSGLTPMGTSLRSKVIDPLVLQPARAGQLNKPVLVITITDGQPAGEPLGAVFDAVRYASSELGRMERYGPGAVAFQFAQVGNDLKAREFLSKLDNDPMVGPLVDCTSSTFGFHRRVPTRPSLTTTESQIMKWKPTRCLGCSHRLA